MILIGVFDGVFSEEYSMVFYASLKSWWDIHAQIKTFIADIDPLNCEYLITHLLIPTSVCKNFFEFSCLTCLQNEW